MTHKRLRKHHATFLDHVMRRKKLEHLVTTGMIEGNRNKVKQQAKMLNELTRWPNVGRVTVHSLHATRDRDV